MKITATSCENFGSGTLMRAYDEMDRFETDDVDQAVSVIQLQTVVGHELEQRGWQFDEDDNEWFYQL